MAQKNRRDGTPVLLASGSLAPITPIKPAPGADGAVQESFLQELMFKHPEVLPLAEIEGAIEGLISVCREMPTSHGYIAEEFTTKSHLLGALKCQEQLLLVRTISST